MSELRRTELIKLVNETIDAMTDVPMIDAPSVAKAALERMPPREPRPDWLGVELGGNRRRYSAPAFRSGGLRLRQPKATKLVDQYFAKFSRG